MGLSNWWEKVDWKTGLDVSVYKFLTYKLGIFLRMDIIHSMVNIKC